MIESITPIDLYELERGLRQRGLVRICGVDEAGRGPLAGPVVAAAVILPEGLMLQGLNDSKKISEKKREELFPLIKEQCVWSIGLATEQEIDEINILNATFLAMRRAVEGLDVIPDYALVDGNRDPRLSVPTTTLVQGDGKAACIAAASILAKVTRDHVMLSLDMQYPQYNFKKHKGYPTKEHYEAVREHGYSPCHRMSFFKKHKP